jgi:hypothetical protein
MASAVSTVIDTCLISVLARMAQRILEDPADQPRNTRNGSTPGAAT